MKIINYLFIDIKILLRIPMALFFTLIFPILMMVIMMISLGNINIGNGFHLIDKYFMVAIGMGILPLTFVSFPMWIGSSLKSKSWQRMNFFGVDTKAYGHWRYLGTYGIRPIWYVY